MYGINFVQYDQEKTEICDFQKNLANFGEFLTESKLTFPWGSAINNKTFLIVKTFRVKGQTAHLCDHFFMIA